MNILQAEDDKEWFERVVKPALINAGACQVFHAVNHDEALEILHKEFIDYLIIDLAIPINRESPTPDITNGLSLATYIRKNFAGTPILILTGQSTEEAVESFIENLPVTTFWDGNQHHIVKVKKK
ncbi:response regulator, partial [Pseudoalteromonas sp. P1-7a]|uniref:response regulator n=1 Tax=Pseudoalteromonas sp. P1-7a TaxID=1723755 RepID=UPI000A813857